MKEKKADILLVVSGFLFTFVFKKQTNKKYINDWAGKNQSSRFHSTPLEAASCPSIQVKDIELHTDTEMRGKK